MSVWSCNKYFQVFIEFWYACDANKLSGIKTLLITRHSLLWTQKTKSVCRWVYVACWWTFQTIPPVICRTCAPVPNYWVSTIPIASTHWARSTKDVAHDPAHDIVIGRTPCCTAASFVWKCDVYDTVICQCSTNKWCNNYENKSHANTCHLLHLNTC